MSKHREKRRHHKHHRKHDWRDWVKKHTFGVSIALGVVAGIVLLAFGVSVARQAYEVSLYEGEYGPELEAELGFTTSTVSIQVGDDKVEVFTIDPVPNGYMDKIGFRDQEIIRSHSYTEFYKMLYTQRGETVSVDLVNGGDGAPIEARKVRTIRFLMPPKQ